VGVLSSTFSLLADAPLLDRLPDADMRRAMVAGMPECRNAGTPECRSPALCGAPGPLIGESYFS
jgi:hypothetical protein